MMPGQECLQTPGRVLGIGEGTLNNVQKMMLGTANLNQMRSEIKTIVTTIASVLVKPGVNDPRCSVYQVGDVTWLIRWDTRNSAIISFTKRYGREQVLYDRYYREPSAFSIQEMHAALDFFFTSVIEGKLIAETEWLEPIFAAAEP